MGWISLVDLLNHCINLGFEIGSLSIENLLRYFIPSTFQLDVDSNGTYFYALNHIFWGFLSKFYYVGKAYFGDINYDIDVQ